MKTLLHGGVIVTCDEENSVVTSGDLVMDGDRITYVGPSYEGDYDVRLDASGHLLLPGLINAHTHSGMSLMRSLADDDDLMVFLERRVWPRETHLTAEDVYAGAALSAVEMLKAGVTTYVDMYFFEESLLRAAADTGARTLITSAILDVPVWSSILGTWEEQLQRSLEFCGRWEGHLGRIHTGLGPHAPYTVQPDALREIAREAHRVGRPVNIHLVETRGERDLFNAQNGVSTVAALNELGFFDGPVIAAHSVWLDGGDVEVYREHHVGVAHCPQSNAKLGVGIAPLVDILDVGVNVGLGTDGPVTNNNLDLWEEIRVAPLLAKLRALDPKEVPARVALAMATRMGAHAVHIPEIGVLREGYRADVIMLDLNDSAAVPVFDETTYISHLVYSLGARNVNSVWVNGANVVRGGEVQTVDEAEVRYRAQQAARSLSERAYH